ncbi:MAG: LysM peptidoglycan-binding domain-containing protein [Muribaculaceae bacterium]
MKIKFFIFSLLLAGASLSLQAQLALPVKTIDNVDYYCYKVKKKETLYGISTKLGISQDNILKYNPDAKQGLKEKQILFLPVAVFNAGKSSSTPKESTKPISKLTHIVAKGETLYGLSKLYNISIEEIVAANPETSNGLKTGQIVVIPQPESISITSPKQQNGTNKTGAKPTDDKIIFHKIKNGETLYSVSRNYNTTIENILELNPGISASNFRYDEVIRVMPNIAKPIVVEQPVTEFFVYEAKKGDTFYSIARDNNVNVDALIAANPEISKLKKGNIVNIPKTRTEMVTVDPSEVSPDKVDKTPVVRKDKHPDTINVALILPFMLNSATPSASARNHTEFYKGFMIAVDSVRKQTRKHFNIYAYDNCDRIKETDSILSLPILKQMNMIIAPSEINQLTAVNRFCNENEIISVNALSVKDDAFNNNPYAFQSNIPPTYLSAEIFDWFDKTFKNHKIVIINDASREKKDIYQELTSHFESKKAAVINVDLNNEFSYSTLSDNLNPGSKYIVVPSSSSKETLAKLLPALKALKQERIDIEVSLFGYPEYCAYLLEYQADLHKVDTYIYTRFFYDATSSRTKAFESTYSRWYGEEMRYTVPRMGLLGFDTGKFFLSTICKGNDPFGSRVLTPYDGIQTSFKFERISNWSGFINKELLFIRFTPFSTIEKM